MEAFLPAIPVRSGRSLLCLAPSTGRDRFTLDVQYSSSGRKIPSLPNNRTNEMIGGCEIRGLSDKCPPPRPLHDDPVECRLVVHGL